MPHTSGFPSFPIPNTSLWSFLFEKQQLSPDQARTKIFQDAYTGRSYDFTGLRDATVEFSLALQERWSWKKGDVLAVFSPNNIDYPVVCLGSLHAGGTFCLMSATLTAPDLAWQLKDSGAKGLVTHPSCLKVAEAAAQQAGLSKDRILLLGHEAFLMPGHFSKLARNLRRREGATPAKVDGSELAMVTYSSGTTGLPKGVRLSHTNLVAVILTNTAGELDTPPGYSSDENFMARTLAVLPFGHIYGVTFFILQPIHEIRTMIVMPKFELEAYCSIIESYRVTFSYVVPPILVLLAKHPVVSKYDLSSLAGFSSAAAPLTRELIESVYERLKIPTRQQYGQSESSPTVTSQPWSRWGKLGSVGVLQANMTLKYMSPDGEEVGMGKEGELWVKGPNIFRGYLNRPDATREAFSDDGWFKTGDIGFQDAEGNVFITDRVKELIKYKGFQVAPAELEGKLLGHPKVADVAVLGTYQEENASEVPLAFLVPSSGITPDEALAKEIVAWHDAQVSQHKKLRGGVRWIESIPKSPTGKILRRVLKEKYGILSVPKRANI